MFKLMSRHVAQLFPMINEQRLRALSEWKAELNSGPQRIINEYNSEEITFVFAEYWQTLVE